MARVNSEWEAALRWIAGWDQSQLHTPQYLHQPLHLHQQQGVTGGYGGNFAFQNEHWKVVGNGRGALYDSTDGKQHGFDGFVDDLARILQACISQCVDDEDFDSRRDEEGGTTSSDSSDVAIGESSSGDMILRSFFSWAIGKSSLPKVSLRKLDTLPPEVKYLFAGALRLALSSIAVYALHSIWSWAISPIFWEWYTSVRGYNESPKWLVEHEREVEMAKQSSQKKKGPSSKRLKRKNTNKQHTNGGKANEAFTSRSATPVYEKLKEQTEDAEEERFKEVGKSYVGRETQIQQIQSSVTPSRNAETTDKATSNDDVASFDDKDRGIPSSISISTSSCTSSPSLKPISSLVEGKNLPDTPTLHDETSARPVPRWNAPLEVQSTHAPVLSQQKQLLVPTQKQREDAANRLREFQNAQIQRLLSQKMVAQKIKLSSAGPSATAPTIPGLLSGTSFQSTGNLSSSNSMLSGKQSLGVPLKPPPGISFNHLSEASHEQNNHDDFLADNELLISKLLDDDDDDDYVEIKAAESEMESFAHETSSLDPSAAPFVSGRSVNTDEKVCPPCPKLDKKQGGANWELSVSPTNGIKGVYGGSVW